MPGNGEAVLLLDTCTFLWWATDDPCVPEPVRTRLRDPNEQVLLSAVSVWEICVKYTLGKLALPVEPEQYVSDRRARLGIAPWALEESDVFALAKLPPLHRDPFDRMLIAQAIARGFILVTPDDAIRAYPARTWWG
ncbi:MAG TPA: type II toxin-antitoxin system VapC family toxin [Polyangiaceae bacterium]